MQVKPTTRPTRPRDAQKTREAILDTAEAAFAQHGFDGARMDAIAKASGYNISLLFQYFTDKLGLYVAVLARADQALNALLEGVLTAWNLRDAKPVDEQVFRSFLEALVRAGFDYLAGHPRFLRIMTWEMAAGWRTYLQIAQQFPPVKNGEFASVFRSVHDQGLLRSDAHPVLQLLKALFLCQSYLAYQPLFPAVIPGEALSSEAALTRAREDIVAFFIAGTMGNP